MNNQKICFESDGTKETGKRIINELIKLGGKDLGLNGTAEKSCYYINDYGSISNTKHPLKRNLTIIELPCEFKVGDQVKVKEFSRFKINGEDSFRNRSLDVCHKLFIYKIKDGLAYIESKDYLGSLYYVVEITNLKPIKSMKNRILTPTNATKIINIACSTWKPKLAEKWATNIVLCKDTEISEEFYVEMRKACTAEQNQLFDTIFGKDEKLIDISELAIGESMIVCGGGHDGTILTRIWTTCININNPLETWSPSPKFKGKRVKLTITHEEVK